MKKNQENEAANASQVIDNESVTVEPTETETTETETTETTTLAEKVTELTEKCAELADQKLRMMAEFDNYRRRVSKEKLELEKTAGEKIFKDMLVLVDDFERALAAMTGETEETQAMRKGIDLIYNKFLSFLEKHEVHPIETKDTVFDTTFHEAIALIPAPTEEMKGKVIDCTQKGYLLGEKVIRYAKVVVGE